MPFPLRSFEKTGKINLIKEFKIFYINLNYKCIIAKQSSGKTNDKVSPYLSTPISHSFSCSLSGHRMVSVR
jgi:hypothetical protein